MRVCRHQRAGTKGAGLRAAGALITTASYLSEEDSAGSLPEPSTFALSPKAASQARMGVDYEYGKVFGKQDADKYFGGMLGELTTCPAVHCPKTCAFESSSA